MGWFLCYQQLLLPVQANFSLPFFLANKPGVLVFLLGCFCTKETATGEAQGIPRCLHPAECPRPAPGAAPVLQGEGCCQPHRPRAEPGSLPGREIPGQPGRALGQIPGAFVEAEPPCATHAAEASERLRDPGRKGCQESFPEQRVLGILPGAGLSLACRGVGWTNPLASSRARGEPRGAAVAVLLRAGCGAGLPTRGTSCSELGAPGSGHPAGLRPSRRAQLPAPGAQRQLGVVLPLPGSAPGFSSSRGEPKIFWGGWAAHAGSIPSLAARWKEGSPSLSEPPQHEAITAPLKCGCWLKSNPCGDGEEQQPSL